MSTQKLKFIKKQQENYKQKQLNVGRVTTKTNIDHYCIKFYQSDD